MKTSGRPVNPRKELLHVLPNIERAVNGERNRSCVGLPLKDDLLLYKDQTARSRVILENSRENRACPRMAIWKTRAPPPLTLAIFTRHRRNLTTRFPKSSVREERLLAVWTRCGL